MVTEQTTELNDRAFGILDFKNAEAQKCKIKLIFFLQTQAEFY
jgi:hypothetical protein